MTSATAPTRIVMHGAAGRMGRSIIGLIAADPGTALCGAVDRGQNGSVGVDAGVLAGTGEPLGVPVSAEVPLDSAEVLIDFSLPEGTQRALSACREHRVAAVVGTTGLDAAAEAAVRSLAEVAPVVWAPNYSVGVNALWMLAERAVQLLGDEYDLEIVEMHHHHKVDAPSGTAAKLAEVVTGARGLSTDALVHGRHGIVGARRKTEVGMHALRGGDVVGEHTLVLAGPGERVEVTHRAHTREIFARGALRAAKWVVGRPPGLYDMGDVLA